MRNTQWFSWLLSTASLTGILASFPAFSQPIQSASDGTGTVVIPNGDRFDIRGGTQSSDSINLFHSFQQFGLNTGQIANFLANPQTQNILGRVTGGNPSLINGLIQVTGGNANLYLINPAGIVFGQNASLNVPASFIATTANGIGFDQGWFNAFGSNNYAALVGNPNAFIFSMNQPGAVVNAGNLAVGEGQSLTLLGGTVVNTGQIKAPAGQITLAAVPGENLVRMSMKGHLLSLEFQPVANNVTALPQNFSVLSLPQLLTGGSLPNDTGIAVNGDGSIQLTGLGTNLAVPGGTTIASGTLDVSGTTGGNVNIWGDKVGLLAANINASGINGGGTIRLGGDYQGQGTIPNASRTYINQDSVISADALQTGNGGRVIVWANQVTGFFGKISARGGENSGNGGFVEVSGKQDLIFRGSVDLSAANGNFGTLLLDPTNITIVSGAGAADDGQLVDNQILQGDGGIGSFTISENALEALPGNANVILEATDNITINALADNLLTFTPGTGTITFTADTDGNSVGAFLMNAGNTIRAEGRNVTISAASITAGNIDTYNTALVGNGGAIALTASGGITTTNLTSIGGAFLCRDCIGNGGAISLTAGGNITVNGLIETRTDGIGNAGAISLNSNATINVNGLSSTAFQGDGGPIALTAAGNINVLEGIASRTDAVSNGNGGAIALSATGNITTGELDSRAFAIGSTGGNLTISSTQGTINTGFLNSGDGFSDGNAGAINLSALDDITIGAGGTPLTTIAAFSRNGSGADIRITSTIGSIDTSAGSIETSAFGTVGNVGSITMTAGGSITTGTLFALSSNSSSSSNGGAIALSATGDITTVRLDSGVGGTGTGGDITVTSTNGAINTSAGAIEAGSAGAGLGNGGNIALSARGNITTSDLLSRSNATGTAGSITITSTAGSIDTTAATFGVDAFGRVGGAIALSAGGDIRTGRINSNTTDVAGVGNAGAITLTAGGNIITTNLLARSLNNSANSGNGGTITVTANNGNISTGFLESYTTSNSGGSASGGAITLSAPNGTINTGYLQASSDSFAGSATAVFPDGGIVVSASGAAITVTAANGITTGNVLTYSGSNPRNAGNGSAINLTSSNGNITTGNLYSYSGALNDNAKNAGAITISANNGSITTNDVDASSFAAGSTGNGGAINFSAGSGITTRVVNKFPASFGAQPAKTSYGNISLRANDIELAGGRNSVVSDGSILLAPATPTQNIALAGSSNSGTNTLDLTTSDLAALQNGFSSITIGGTDSSGLITVLNSVTFNDPVTIQSPVGTGEIRANGTITGLDDASITLRANNNITTNNITATPGISLISSSGAITTNNLNSSGAIDGGNIRVEANTSITTGQINSSSTTGRGGNVTLDPIGDIQVGSINTQGGTTGGTVDITTNRFFRATDTFNSSNNINSSISTVGGSTSGNITIRHGGQGITPFDVGNATTNGTAGAITSGNFTIAPQQSFPYTYTLGNINIISVDAPPVPPTPPDPKINAVDFNLPPTETEIPTLYSNTSLLLIDSPIAQIEKSFTDSYSSYLGISDPPAIVSLEQAQANLRKIEQSAGVKPALIYAVCRPTSGNLTNPTNSTKQGKSTATTSSLWEFNALGGSSTQQPVPSTNQRTRAKEQLQLILVTSQGKPVQRLVKGVTCEQVLAQAQTFRKTVTDIRSNQSYLASAQQFYQWLIAPIEQDLQARNINNLTFIMDEGLRSIPLAAIHDGTGFIVQRYSVGLMPSLSLSDTRYVDVRNNQVLGMGASQFTELRPLIATPVELSLITGKLWRGQSFLNEGFTLENLRATRSTTPYGIIHLATHAEFKSGEASNSYIQLWNSKLTLDQLRKLGLNDPPVELLVLSACRTALGDESAELGFTGLAVQAGVKSALGSLWYVSDEGTLGLMTEFYQQLKQAPIKAEALRRSQLAMLQGKVKLQAGQLITSSTSVSLPPELAKLASKDLTHPYYWSAFTLIGNPW